MSTSFRTSLLLSGMFLLLVGATALMRPEPAPAPVYQVEPVSVVLPPGVEPASDERAQLVHFVVDAFMEGVDEELASSPFPEFVKRQTRDRFATRLPELRAALTPLINGLAPEIANVISQDIPVGDLPVEQQDAVWAFLQELEATCTEFGAKVADA